MSKLYFNYGTVASSKTLNLLAVYKNYELQGRNAILIRPQMDTRSDKVESRAGLSAEPDITLGSKDDILLKIKDYMITKIYNDHNKLEVKSLEELQKKFNKVAEAVIVDESQFLSVEQIKDLRSLSATGIYIQFPIDNDHLPKDSALINKENPINFVILHMCLPVMCYGLRTNSDGVLWDAAAILMAQADEINEIKTICSYCNHRAVFSAINPERACNNSEGIVNPSWGLYIPVCPKHFAEIQAKLNNKQQ